jgi:hypothetical protein
MKYFLTILIFLTIKNAGGQVTYVYEPNPLTGNVEILKTDKSKNIYREKVSVIKRNPISGYFEIEETKNQNLIQEPAINPYSNRPNFELVYQIKPFNVGYENLIEQINTLNKRFEFDNVNQLRQNNNLDKNKLLFIDNFLKNYYENMNTTAKNLLNFYNAQTKFTQVLKDGFYYTTEILNNSIVNVNNKLYADNQINAELKTILGIAKVINNKLVEYYETMHIDEMSKNSNVFKKFNLEVTSTINNCKAIFREKGIQDIKTIYFFDNIIDPEFAIPDPKFGVISFNTSSIPSASVNSNYSGILLKVARNKAEKITQEELKSSDLTKGNFGYAISYATLNDNNNSCANNSVMIAFKPNIGNYSIGVSYLNLSLKQEFYWSFDNIIIGESSCNVNNLSIK